MRSRKHQNSPNSNVGQATNYSHFQRDWAFMQEILFNLHFSLTSSTDDFRWVREVFMTGTMGLRRMGRKLDFEREERFTFHLLQRDSQVGNVEGHNVVEAIDHSKRVIVILSA